MHADRLRHLCDVGISGLKEDAGLLGMKLRDCTRQQGVGDATVLCLYLLV